MKASRRRKPRLEAFRLAVIVELLTHPNRLLLNNNLCFSVYTLTNIELRVGL
jgi:hypothetical protein